MTPHRRQAFTSLRDSRYNVRIEYLDHAPPLGA